MATNTRVKVGTIGQVGHGKTTLTAATTKFLAEVGETNEVSFSKIDEGSEEKFGGVTISAAHVEYETTRRAYENVDWPAPSEFVKNFITGAFEMSGCILVVSATEGPMPQTKEQIILAAQMGVSSIVCFMNKVDQVDDPERLDSVEIEIRELLTTYGFPGDDLPVIRGSALLALNGTSTNEGIMELLNAIDLYIPDTVSQVGNDETSRKEFTAQMYVLTKDEGGRTIPFFNNLSTGFDFGSTEVSGRVGMLDYIEMALPGDIIKATVQLVMPISLKEGQRFTFKEGETTIGVGFLLR